ncbi:hypothetical protein AMECASPLE_030942 [Ameca splendens]|uniref:Uncharacterized protein n=1 Tax=Ameca splendens TaxID=208324 RepID=A0ABV0Z426_9TELE
MRKPLGMLIESSFHDFELTIPVIGDLSLFVSGTQDSPDILLMFPSDIITVGRQEVLTTKSTCGATLGAEGNLVVYALATHQYGFIWVHIPMNPYASPTFVCQCKIPLAAYNSI